MITEILTKELAQKLMKIKGEARGMCLRVDWEFVLGREGKEGLKRIEEKMAEMGHPLKYKEIKTMDFYPIGIDAVSMLAIKELFNFDDSDIEKMGAASVKFSILLKIFLKYFGSLRMIAPQIPEIWRRHYSIGELEMSEFSEKERYTILKLKRFEVHPIYCIVFRGYFSKVAEMIVKSPVTCKETKCAFLGDEHHEFFLKW